MNEELDTLTPKDQNERPSQLTVVAILSFVNIGWSLLSGITSAIAGPMSDDQIEDYKVQVTKSISDIKDLGNMRWAEDFMRDLIVLTEQTNAHFMTNFISSTLFLIIGLAGVFLMFTRRKIGFHFYIIYCFLASVQIYFFITPSLFSNTVVGLSLLASLVFILLYARHLKWMK